MKKQYLVIASRAPRPRRLGELIGVTTKRTANPEDRKTIGFFGTGSKMAPALAMRLGIDVSVFSTDDHGPYRLTYGTLPIPGVEQRQVIFQYRTPGLKKIHSVPAGFSNEIGVPHWSRADQVVREYVIDAFDADPGFGYLIATIDPDRATLGHLIGLFRGRDPAWTEFRTFALIEVTQDVHEVAEDFDRRFRLPRPGVVFRDELHRAGLRAIIRKKEPGPLQIYVRGIRCSLAHLGQQDLTSTFDYCLDVPLNEEREIRSWWDVLGAIGNVWAACDNVALIKALIAMTLLDKPMGRLERNELTLYSVSDAWAAAFKEFPGLILASGKSELDEAAAQRGNRILRMHMLSSHVDTLPRVSSDITTPGMFRPCPVPDDKAEAFALVVRALARVLKAGTDIQPCMFGDACDRAAIIDDAGTVLVDCGGFWSNLDARKWLRGCLSALRGLTIGGSAQALRTINYDPDAYAADALIGEAEGQTPGAAIRALGIPTAKKRFLCSVDDDAAGLGVAGGADVLYEVTHDASLATDDVAVLLREQRSEIRSVRLAEIRTVTLAAINNEPETANVTEGSEVVEADF